MALTDKVAFALLADLKTDLGVSGSGSDTTLERRILAASAMIEAWCGRQFRRETVTGERVKAEGWVSVYLSRTPVASVSALTFSGATVSPSAYTLEAGKGRLYRPDGWAWTAGFGDGAAPELIPGTEDAGALLATYVGGYVLPNDTDQAPTPKLPEDIIEACLQWSTILHRSAGRDPNVVQEQVGDASISYAVNSIEERRGAAPPAAIVVLLAPYRRVL